MVKKVIIAILIATMIVISFFCCIKVAEYRGLVHLTRNNKPLHNIYPLKVYLDDGNYVVVVFENGKAVKGVRFSEGRQPVNTIGLKLTTIANLEQYLGEDLNAIESQFGSYHVDIGSGFFMPSYITTDGYLICFTIEVQHGNIIHVGKTDLYSGESVEWFVTDDVK